MFFSARKHHVGKARFYEKRIRNLLGCDQMLARSDVNGDYGAVDARIWLFVNLIVPRSTALGLR